MSFSYAADSFALTGGDYKIAITCGCVSERMIHVCNDEIGGRQQGTEKIEKCHRIAAARYPEQDTPFDEPAVFLQNGDKSVCYIAFFHVCVTCLHT